MMWFAIFAGIAVLWLAITVGYAVWLWHKASDLIFEAKRIGSQVGEVGELVSAMVAQLDEKVG